MHRRAAAAALFASALLSCERRAPIEAEPEAGAAGAAARAPIASASASAAPSPSPSTSAAPIVRTTTGAACPQASPIGRVALSQDGKALVTTCGGLGPACKIEGEKGEQPVDVWELPRGAITHTLDAGAVNVLYLAWGKGGWLATLGEPTTGAGEVHLYDTATWTLRANVPSYCAGIQFSPSGGALAIAFADGELRSLSTRTFAVTSRPNEEAHLGGDYWVDVEFSSDEKTLFVNDESEGLQALSAQTLRRTFQAPLPEREAPRAFSPDASRVAYCRKGGAVDVLEGSLRVRHPLVPARGDDACPRLRWVDDRRILIGRKQGEIELWDAAARKRLRVIRASDGRDAASDLIVDPLRATLAVEEPDGLLSLWDLASDAPKPRLSFRVGSAALSFDPTSARVAGTFVDHATAWDTKTGNVVANVDLAADSDRLRDLQWSEDGRFFVVSDGAAHLVRVADGASIELTVFERDGKRDALIRSKHAFAGPADLVPCATKGDGLPKLVPTLVEDFFAGRPLP